MFVWASLPPACRQSAYHMLFWLHHSNAPHAQTSEVFSLSKWGWGPQAEAWVDSTFLINIFWGISVFQLGIFVNVNTLLTNWYILCLIAAMYIITCYSKLTFFSQIILNNAENQSVSIELQTAVIKSGNHDFLIALSIRNFFCFLLHYQINFNVFLKI